jgi:hypothetical protein
MAQSGTAPDQRRQHGADTDEEVLRAQLAVRPHPESSCAVVGGDREAAAVTHHLKRGGPRADGTEPRGGCECHAEVVYTEGGEQSREYHTSPVSSKCICPVFEQHDCVPEIKAVENGSIIVVVSVPNRAALRQLLDGLRQVGAVVVVDWLVSGDNSEVTTEIDVSSITSKQRQALERALEAGYYDEPREADLADLADELGISRSAVSQRLNAAETKLVKAFLDDETRPDDAKPR